MAKGGPRIMVVEDEEFVRCLLQDFLELNGMEVISASRGDEAVELFSRHKGEVDLVILDLVLPGMMGEEIFMALKELDPQVKVLVATGLGKTPSLERLRREGILGVVTKPFDFARLLETIRSVLHDQA